MEDAICLLPITPMEKEGNEKGKVYHAHGTLRQFMIELVVSLSSSQHASHTLGREGDGVMVGRKDRCNNGKNS